MSKGSNEDGDGSNDYGEDLIKVRLGWQRWWWGLQTAPMMIHAMDEEEDIEYEDENEDWDEQEEEGT